MVKFFQSHSQKHKTSFLWKYFVTSHGKGLVDGIGGKAKALVVWAKVMSTGDDKIIVQSSNNFSKVAEQLIN